MRRSTTIRARRPARRRDAGERHARVRRAAPGVAVPVRGAPDPAAAATAPARIGPTLAALALGGFAIGTTEFVAMGLLPQIARGVAVSLPAGGHVVSAYALGVVVGAPLLAGLGARLPRRTLLVGLMAAFAAGNLLSALAPTGGPACRSEPCPPRSASGAWAWSPAVSSADA